VTTSRVVGWVVRSESELPHGGLDRQVQQFRLLLGSGHADRELAELDEVSVRVVAERPVSSRGVTGDGTVTCAAPISF
jgi:hypothetical protein